jgi:hypothetical protein
LTKAGTKKARQAWYELAIKENLNVNMGDAIYYINTGTKKNESDVTRETRYYYIDGNGQKIDYLTDENGEKKLDRKGNVISLAKYIKSEHAKIEKRNTSGKALSRRYCIDKYIFPDKKILEEDVVLFKCVLLPNTLVEDEEDHFCDENLEYNRAKYIDMFNKRIKPLMVVFDKEVREKVNEKGKVETNILITDPKDRKVFTEEECILVSGQPFNATDQDTYEQLMTMEDKEIRFWKEVNKKPPYIDYIDGMNWEEILNDYDDRMKELEKEGIRDDVIKYQEVINSLTQNDVNEFIENGVLPEKLKNLVEEDFNTGEFKSKKWGVKLGDIYDIIDHIQISEEIDE